MSYSDNFVMISSLIKTTDAPFSYHPCRSVYSHEERYNQTLQTIKSVKDKIPNCKICLIDCSLFSDEEERTLKEHCDYFINVYDDEYLHETLLFSNSKALCECLQTMKVISFVKQNNIQFKNFFKITGRYVLNDNFHYEIFDNEYNIGKDLKNTSQWLTSLYKLNNKTFSIFYDALQKNIDNCKNCMEYEQIIRTILDTQKNTRFVETIGIDEYISVSGQFRSQ